MVRRYEAMFIVDADLEDDQIQKILDRYSKVITDGGGTISYAGRWEQGRRKLAYEIARRREGMYLITQFESDAAVPKELDRLFRISDEVFRHIIIRPDENVPPLTEQSAAAAAPEPAPEVAPEPVEESEEPAEITAEAEPVPETPEAEETPAAEEEAGPVEETESEPAAV